MGVGSNPTRAREGAMYVLMGKMGDYEKLEGDPEIFPLRPLRNTRTNFIFKI